MPLSSRSELLLPLLLACGGGEASPEPAVPAPQAEPPAAARSVPAAPTALTDAPAERKAEDLRIRGILALGDAPALRTCAGQPPPLDGLDAVARSVASLLGRDLSEVYVELRLARADAPGSYRVEGLDVATAEGPGCAQPADFAVRAFGNEPGWVLSLQAGQASLLTQAEGSLAAVPVAGPELRGDGVRTWTATLEDGRALRLEVAPERCLDTMASALYPSTATLVLGDQRLSGCARPRPPLP